MSNVPIPLLLEKRLVFLDEVADFSKFVAPEVNRACEPNRAEPELRVALCLLNVDMRWLVSFAAEKKESIPFNPQNSWHSSLIAHPASEEKAAGSLPSSDWLLPSKSCRSRERDLRQGGCHN
jgi:hypothetical protein